MYTYNMSEYPYMFHPTQNRMGVQKKGPVKKGYGGVIFVPGSVNRVQPDFPHLTAYLVEFFVFVMTSMAAQLTCTHLLI